MKSKRGGGLAFYFLCGMVAGGLGWWWWTFHQSGILPKVSHPQPNQAQAAAEPKVLVLIKPSHPAPTTVSNVPQPAKVSVQHTNPVLLKVDLEQKPQTSPSYPRPVQTALELQVALARLALSPGSLDGVLGPQTQASLKSFQQKQHLPATGQLDESTRQLLILSTPPTTNYVVCSNDLTHIQPLSLTWLGKSQQSALDYESLLELVAEKSQASPNLIRRLNPGAAWTNPVVCSCLTLPDAIPALPSGPAAFLTIRLSEKILEAWDDNTNLVAHFPCSIARLVEKRPVGELHVATIALNPNYTLDPANFPESAEVQSLKTKLILPPGPNNPVGTAWIGLDKPGYGIHGTPQPEQVGRTESHGCFRLANWNVDYLVHLVTIGTPVRVEP